MLLFKLLKGWGQVKRYASRSSSRSSSSDVSVRERRERQRLCVNNDDMTPLSEEGRSGSFVEKSDDTGTAVGSQFDAGAAYLSDESESEGELPSDDLENVHEGEWVNLKGMVSKCSVSVAQSLGTCTLSTYTQGGEMSKGTLELA